MSTRQRTLAFLLALPALTLVALTTPVLATVPLWRDEDATWAFSTLGYRDLVTATGHVDRVFLPYYSLVHTLRLLGLGEAACRGVSVLAAIGTVTAVQLVARRLWSATAGFVAALAIVMNPMFLATATSLRPYALATFLSALATWLIVCRPRHIPLRWRWWLYLALITAGAQLHLFSATLVVPHLAWMWLRVRPRVRPVARAWGIALALTAPLAYLASHQSGQVGWISSPTWESTARQTALASGATPGTLGIISVLVVAACALLGVYQGWRRHRVDPTWLIGLLLWLWPVAALTLVSLVATPVSVWRYYMSTSVGAALLVGYGANVVRVWAWTHRPHRLANRHLVATLAACAAACMLPALLVGRPATTTLEGHPVVDAHLARSVRAGDLVVVQQGMSETGYAYGFARGLHDTAFAHDAVRSLVAGQPGFFVREVVGTDGRTVTSRAATASPGHDVWLLRLDPVASPPGLDLRRCRTLDERAVQQTTLAHLAC